MITLGQLSRKALNALAFAQVNGYVTFDSKGDLRTVDSLGEWRGVWYDGEWRDLPRWLYEEPIYEAGEYVNEPVAEEAEEDMMEKLGKAFNTVKDETVHGVKVASAQEVAEGMVTVAKEVVGDVYPKAFGETEFGQAVEPWALAAGCIVAAECFGDRLPKSAEVEAIARLALQGTSKDGAKIMTKKLKPLFERLGQLASSLPEGMIGGEKVEE